ncbi:CRISPR-associated protein Cas4 [Pectinatus haikarae]|uniref:CRISPR-associated exonuclease Cas4 n=1 Tax=Pectinatus haikarae TaxID=349096 RepID=A0ABT9YAC9_9FIRM|nr:CRISPR-associated protein Cas4 [Pectinatus haikarae]MDQ0204450.1 CRISPR-associated exonuclease Cas4 [Pectinatus haikarae]
MMVYEEDKYLQIAEIQHFAYCPRQWAIAYLENQWQENVLTVEGHALHDRAHDESIKEKRKNCITVRGMPVMSRELGICGTCDVVEFIADKTGISIPSYQGKYRIVPIEYKRGRPKEGEEDLLQLTVQSMCLEEMLAVDIPVGFFYYAEIRRRMKVLFDETIKEHVREMLRQMRDYLKRSYTPLVKKRKGCANCSVKDICIPKLNKKKSAQFYMKRRLEE